MEGHIDLKSLSMDSLAGVVNLYPWFGTARKELCIRMRALNGNEWSEAQYADAALFLPSRRKIADSLKRETAGSCTDSDVKRLVKMYIEEGGMSGEKAVQPYAKETPKPRLVGGDFFSKDQYAGVQMPELHFSLKDSAEAQPAVKEAEEADFCTETLAQIYAEQGYYEQAAQMYSKLILAYPEKSAYFATLIEKLQPEN